ncbi:MAG: RNA-binding transcriptional accessory protein, partial [Flammeovirgaceae bacterium]|nr:RNA-binding transcriptional accessory protein [Flammeovirgaceae bacterium]MDW8287580.1 Tex-like N-terminal domain-containing protein [Flammeovirgaceae bacterium]
MSQAFSNEEQRNIFKIATELGLREKQVEATVRLLDEGATIPFLARYRKEVTGSLDEVAISVIRDRMEQLRELDKRRESIIRAIEEQGKMTNELLEKLIAAQTINELEDIYLPYKPKRRTRAAIAREKGLEPLANLLLDQENIDIFAEAQKYISDEKQVKDVEEALAGARDIIAEKVNEDIEARQEIRILFEKKGTFVAKIIPGKEEEGAKYKDYFNWSEPVITAPSHRILAMRRAEKELIITLDVAPDEEEAIGLLEKRFVKKQNAAGEQVALAVKDAYKRLMKPSMETEIRMMTKKKADEEAIRVFAENLRQLLLSPPMGQKRVLAIDPGYRTGCKVVCLDAQGKLLDDAVIYPNEPQRKVSEAGVIVRDLCKKYQIEAIAIGNGTASRETEAFVRSLNIPNV